MDWIILMIDTFIPIKFPTVETVGDVVILEIGRTQNP